jgi:hypothetical protein
MLDGIHVASGTTGGSWAVLLLSWLILPCSSAIGATFWCCFRYFLLIFNLGFASASDVEGVFFSSTQKWSWAGESGGTKILGFRYLLNAAEGGSSEGGGRRSSVNPGWKSKMELDRKSSGWMSGGVVARLDTVWAADFKALNEAVRLDLNEVGRLSGIADLRFGFVGGDITNSGVVAPL